MPKVTADQIRDAMVRAGIESVDHHNCAVCGSMVRYSRKDDCLFFDPSCFCAYSGGPEPRSWQDAADWINMQSKDSIAEEIAARFGLTKKEGDDGPTET